MILKKPQNFLSLSHQCYDIKSCNVWHLPQTNIPSLHDFFQNAAVPPLLADRARAILISFLAGLPHEPTKQIPDDPQHVLTAQTLPVLFGTLQSEVSTQGVKPAQIAF